MSESLSLLSDGGGGGGVGGGERGGVVDIVELEEFWSIELVPPLVVDFASYSGLLWSCIVFSIEILCTQVRFLYVFESCMWQGGCSFMCR